MSNNTPDLQTLSNMISHLLTFDDPRIKEQLLNNFFQTLKVSPGIDVVVNLLSPAYISSLNLSEANRAILAKSILPLCTKQQEMQIKSNVLNFKSFSLSRDELEFVRAQYLLELQHAHGLNPKIYSRDLNEIIRGLGIEDFDLANPIILRGPKAIIDSVANKLDRLRENPDEKYKFYLGEIEWTIRKKAAGPNESYSNDRLEDCLRRLSIVNFKVVDGKEANVLEVADPGVITWLLKEHALYEQKIFITPQMASDIYKAVEQRGLGKIISDLNNQNRNANNTKFAVALKLLGIECHDVQYGLQGGYMLQASRHTQNNILNNDYPGINGRGILQTINEINKIRQVQGKSPIEDRNSFIELPKDSPKIGYGV